MVFKVLSARSFIVWICNPCSKQIQIKYFINEPQFSKYIKTILDFLNS